MFSKILIANRGEIALRVIRACKELGITAVAVFSDADRTALHTKYADEAYNIGPPPPSESYLNTSSIIDTARRSGSEAIHPGYGFLAQIPEFAEQCEAHSIAFIGPSSRTLHLMGNKLTARKTMRDAGIPVIPGSMDPVETEDAAKTIAAQLGYPVLVKAVYGGGGKGLRKATTANEITQAIELVKLEAEASFGNAEIYVEKLLENPRHIEVQILADKQGNVIHLGERECSIQRKHQKLIEETPSPLLTESQRITIGDNAIAAGKAVDYVSAGTVEFLVSKDGAFHFLEMNTRLQVEHLVTEMVTGIDIVKAQLRIAAGEQLPCTQSDVHLDGHALNCRINAEDPAEDFAPSPGTITTFHLPGGPGVRVDTAMYSGCDVPLFYDSLIAKIATWGHERQEAVQRMINALDELSVNGVETTAAFLQKILRDEDYQLGHLHTRFVEERMRSLVLPSEDLLEDVAVVSAVVSHYLSNRQAAAAVVPARNERHASMWKAAWRAKLFPNGDWRWIR